MKFSLFSLLALLPAFAHAKIQVEAISTIAISSDQDATYLMNTLQALGARAYKDTTGHERVSAKGDITITNGAACDNGRITYSVTLKVLDMNGKETQTLSLDQTNGCQKPSKAERFAKLLDKWGGSILQGDCGAGHCWRKISSIECIDFPASGNNQAFKSCDVILGRNDEAQ